METEYKSPSMSRRQLLAAYMKARKKALCLGVICIVIFLVIMLLFYYPVDGIIYASIYVPAPLLFFLFRILILSYSVTAGWNVYSRQII